MTINHFNFKSSKPSIEIQYFDHSPGSKLYLSFDQRKVLGAEKKESQSIINFNDKTESKIRRDGI